jgi:hypothetical protein
LSCGKGGRLPADGLVAKTLFECAVGYEWVEEQPVVCTEVTYGENKKLRETERVKIVNVKRRLPRIPRILAQEPPA